METAAQNKGIQGKLPRNLNVSAAGWAFEFLRRNPEFQEAVASHKGKVRFRHQPAATYVSNQSDNDALDRFAVLFCDRTDCSIDQATIVWRPDDNNDVIDVRIEPSPNNEVAGSTLRLQELSCEKLAFTTPDYPTQLFLRDGVKQLQLSCIEGTPTNGEAAIIPLISPHRHIERQLLNMRRLFHLYSYGEFPNSLYKPDPKSLRLSEVLNAFDLWRADASMRDIAIAIYDEQLVEEDWAPEGGYLIDRVRRLIRRGRYLVKTGYRTLLP